MTLTRVKGAAVGADIKRQYATMTAGGIVEASD